jgi:hypothetical protein
LNYTSSIDVSTTLELRQHTFSISQLAKIQTGAWTAQERVWLPANAETQMSQRPANGAETGFCDFPD